MSADECRDELKGEKEEVLRRHRAAVETSLAQENFLDSSDMTILQAFVLYTICGRFDAKGPDTRKLTDIAIAIARKNDMHQDGAKMDLTPLEVEMRHRIWWQIYILDVRTAEDRGCDPTILESAFNTSLPTNVNDSNLHPEMSVAPQTNPGKTEMLFSLVRLEGSNFARQMVFSDKFCHENDYPILSISQKCQEIDRFKERIESQYLSLCDNAIPLDFVTVVSIRLILVKLKLTVSKPRTKQSQNLIMHGSFRQTCVEILERARMLRLFEKGKKWLWLFQTYLEWDALAYLLINLSLVPSGDGVDLAWNATEDIYHYWKSNSDVYLDKRWMNIEELRSQALLAKNMLYHFPNMFGLSPRDSQAGESTRSVNLSPHGEAPTRGSPCRVQGQSSERDVGLSELTGIPAEQSQTREDTVSTLQHEQTRVIMEGPKKSQQSEMTKDFSEIPSSGTACQWSTGLFERYFQVLDMEQDLFADAA
ncbi:uncharacterized protein N7459_000507 [Penicillium hispanicum]|uniref:uncharacterized protein n=1 Tax=Penicillium hispanicum TaxID=1080232 RepID=UPI0025425A59|nr:uncharacterized protein N7459_000507 [Penicillium hispanicum]KAJ5594299.1 hypothetical protein N7459_000507 [Penicillium hispanicum]